MESWKNTETLVVWLFIILGFLGLLITFIVILIRASHRKNMETVRRETELKLEHQRKLLTSTVSTQEVERNRIAIDLHDEISGSLLAVKMKLDRQNASLGEELEECLHSIRRISHDLYPPLLEESTFEELIQDVMEARRYDFEIDFFTVMHVEKNLSEKMKLQLLRILQELLYNVQKHANANKVRIQLRVTEKYTQLLIVDNGVGFPPETISGLGMKSLEARMQLVKGSHKIKSVPTKGSRIIINIKHTDHGH